MKKYAVIGHPVGHSKSPKIFEILKDFFSDKISYEALDIEPKNLFPSFETLKKYDGFNVTSPHKQNILEMVSVKSAEVEILGAANVLKNDGGKFQAFNTDVYGFVRSLKGFDLKDKNVLVLGGSGAARAVILGLTRMGVESIQIKSRSQQKGIPHSVKKYNESFVPDVVIQATTIGLNKTLSEMKDHQDLKFFDFDYSKVQIAYDLNYSPKVTPFMEIAQNNNIPTVMNGESMLAHQALKTFEIWSGKNLSENEREQMLSVIKGVL